MKLQSVEVNVISQQGSESNVAQKDVICLRKAGKSKVKELMNNTSSPLLLISV